LFFMLYIKFLFYLFNYFHRFDFYTIFKDPNCNSYTLKLSNY